MKKLWKMKWLLAVVLVMGLLLTACGKEKEKESKVDKYVQLEQEENAFLIFYDPSSESLLQSFREHHPNIEIDIQKIDYIEEDGLVLKDMIETYGPPDLILGGAGEYAGVYSEVPEDICDLPRCYEQGYIADLRTFCANDASIDSNAYFPGTFEVFQNKNHLYALPLGISMDFLLTTDSKYDNSAFSELEDGYNGRELMNVLLKEVEEKREFDEFFCPEDVPGIRLLYQLGGVTETEAGIQVDEEIFKKVYEYTYMNNKKAGDAKIVWAEEGKSFSVDNGFVQRTAFEPRAYEGKFIASFWVSMDAPAIALSYATTANQYHVDEGTKAIYIPNYDDGNAYTAAVRVYGAVGAESKRQELAYELLRLLMDEEISYFKIHDDAIYNVFGFSASYNLYPVNKERALELLDGFESKNAMMLYGHQGQGRYMQILDIVPVSEEEKVKHENMLNGISGMTYLDEETREASSLIWEYQYMEIEDYKQCYDKVVKALNADLPK